SNSQARPRQRAPGRFVVPSRSSSDHVSASATAKVLVEPGKGAAPVVNLVGGRKDDVVLVGRQRLIVVGLIRRCALRDALVLQVIKRAVACRLIEVAPARQLLLPALTPLPDAEEEILHQLLR